MSENGLSIKGTLPEIQGNIVFGRVDSAIESSDLIPKVINKAIREFIKESFEVLWKTIEELKNVEPPPELLEYWDIVLQVLQSIQ